MRSWQLKIKKIKLPKDPDPHLYKPMSLTIRGHFYLQRLRGTTKKIPKEFRKKRLLKKNLRVDIFSNAKSRDFRK